VRGRLSVHPFGNPTFLLGDPAAVEKFWSGRKEEARQGRGKYEKLSQKVSRKPYRLNHYCFKEDKYWVECSHTKVTHK